MTVWYRVQMPPRDRKGGFVCGISVVDGYVTEAAPIMRWTIRKGIADVTDWVKTQGGTIERLEVKSR